MYRILTALLLVFALSSGSQAGILSKATGFAVKGTAIGIGVSLCLASKSCKAFVDENGLEPIKKFIKAYGTAKLLGCLDSATCRRAISKGRTVLDEVLTGIGSDVEETGDEENNCPPIVPLGEEMRERPWVYQQYVTGLPDPSLGYVLDGVKFDGCRESDGTMLEAKGYGYAKLMGNEWFTGDKALIAQAERQERAARVTNRRVEWHFAEKLPADTYRALFDEVGYLYLTVVFDPMPGQE